MIMCDWPGNSMIVLDMSATTSQGSPQPLSVSSSQLFQLSGGNESNWKETALTTNFTWFSSKEWQVFPQAIECCLMTWNLTGMSPKTRILNTMNRRIPRLRIQWWLFCKPWALEIWEVMQWFIGLKTTCALQYTDYRLVIVAQLKNTAYQEAHPNPGCKSMDRQWHLSHFQGLLHIILELRKDIRTLFTVPWFVQTHKRNPI